MVSVFYFLIWIVQVFYSRYQGINDTDKENETQMVIKQNPLINLRYLANSKTTGTDYMDVQFNLENFRFCVLFSDLTVLINVMGALFD